MELQHIDIENLKTTTLNVRKKGAKSVDDLLPSIRSLGIIQPLLVRKNCEGYEIIAGQRRFYAATKLVEEGINEPLPCIVMQEGDNAKAIEASLAENIARLPMDELDQYKAFAALVKQGRSVDDIASQFGVSGQLVKKRLAIANIIAPILTLYGKEEIDAQTLRLFTLATKAQQKKWLGLYKSDDENAPEGYRLKEWLFGGSEIPVENALFDIGDYKGNIVTDLFEEASYFDDAQAFWALQNTAISKARDAYLEDGWQEVIILDVGAYFQQWDYQQASREDGGKIYIAISNHGEVTFHEGLITQAEAKRREKTKAGSDDATVQSERPELTKAMQNYLALHRHSAVRTNLLKRPDIALRLSIAQMIAGSPLWSVHAEPQAASTDVVAESVTSNGWAEPFDCPSSKIYGQMAA